MGTVSVVIPFHNASPYLERAIHSVQDQTLQAHQILCIDDGSTDDSLAVLERLQGASNDRIEILSQRHSGSAVARNLGLSRSTGEHIQFLDADDVLMPRKIEHQLSLFEESGGKADVVAGSFLDISRSRLPLFVGPKYQDPWANLITTGLGTTSANLWRRQAVLDMGGWNERQSASQEYELMFRLMRRNPIVLLSHEPLTEKYQVDGSIQSVGQTGERRRSAILSYILLRRSIAEYLDSQGMLGEHLRRLYREVLHFKLRDLSVLDYDLAYEIHQQEIPKDFRLPATDGMGIAAREDFLFFSKT